MADTSSSNRRRQSSRLQRRAPASIQVLRPTDWNVAIPLLSPLASSPPSINRTVEIDSSASQTTSSRAEQTKPIVFKKWQHPAVPFCYDSAPSSLAPFGSCRF
ncbi:uncharacterized protein At4g14450, chloroplastic-like [Chenopodium quinoa]|uniref:uncharacterized protein At4g14450, chloroplastic-like n=1 Tax=Chenopodium quinoa TaxID=63459 RepID=UPI000B7798A4|nr:uncharacterized protein At4g14450, chloroplastic-like [Chenopodium quinoa]